MIVLITLLGKAIGRNGQIMGRLLMWLVAPLWLASASGAIAWWVWLLPIAELERRFFEKLEQIGREDD